MKRTKIAFILAAMLGVSDAAFADHAYFEMSCKIPRTERLNLGLVRSDAGGVVEVYAYNAGQMGELLGTADLVPGVNDMVLVNVGIGAPDQVMAIIKNGDEEVAHQVYYLD